MDARNGKEVDIVKAGIIDPTKVVKTAVINATAVVTTMLSTNNIITNLRHGE